MENYSVCLFHSTSSAIRCEKETKKAGLKVKLIPAPRHLSSDCGSCLRFLTKNRETVEGILTEKRIDYDSIHIL